VAQLILLPKFSEYFGTVHRFLHNKMVTKTVLHGGTQSTHKGNGLNRRLFNIISMDLIEDNILFQLSQYIYVYRGFSHHEVLICFFFYSTSPKILLHEEECQRDIVTGKSRNV
jgi:hypothetical protein